MTGAATFVAEDGYDEEFLVDFGDGAVFELEIESELDDDEEELIEAGLSIELADQDDLEEEETIIAANDSEDDDDVDDDDDDEDNDDEAVLQAELELESEYGVETDGELESAGLEIGLDVLAEDGDGGVTTVEFEVEDLLTGATFEETVEFETGADAEEVEFEFQLGNARLLPKSKRSLILKNRKSMWRSKSKRTTHRLNPTC